MNLQKEIILEIRRTLKSLSDKNIQESSKHFFKEPIKLYGIKTATVRKIAQNYFKQIKDLDKRQIYQLCDKLWASGYMEESFIASHWSYSLRKKFEKKDFKLFEKWVNKYISNWASCDTFCNHTLGAFIELYPEFSKSLIRWTYSKNRWVQRASAVTFIIPARRGLFLKEILKIATALMKSEDDLVQKGYGWALKSASQAEQKLIFDYINKNKQRMPRTALRYAIEKMPIKLKKIAMQK